MEPVSVFQIEAKLRQLPPDKLAIVYDFVSYLADREPSSETYQTMLSSESVLGQDWNKPEEDAAWSHL